MNAETPVNAAGDVTSLLNQLGNMFFKGFDGILSRAAEYQDDYGVLKQVTKIPIKLADGTKTALTIKLSPIKDGDDSFYVEVDPVGDDFDVSSINKKKVRINKTSINTFNKMIKDLVEKNGATILDSNYVVEDSDSEDEEDTSNEDSDANDSEDEEDSKQNEMLQKIDSMLDEIDAEFEDNDVIVKDNEGNKYNLTVETYRTDDGQEIIISLAIYKGSVRTNMEIDESISSTDTRNKLITLNKLKRVVTEIINDFLSDNDLTMVTTGILSSTSIKATFIKSSTSNKVDLVAINTSSDLDEAMQIIYNVTDDDDFINELCDEPRSFEIIDVGNGYDIEPTDSFETCCIIKEF